MHKFNGLIKVVINNEIVYIDESYKDKTNIQSKDKISCINSSGIEENYSYRENNIQEGDYFGKRIHKKEK